MKKTSAIKRIFIVIFSLCFFIFISVGIVWLSLKVNDNPDFEIIFEEVFGLKFSDEFIVVSSKEVSDFEGIFSKRQGEYIIQFNKANFSLLIMMIEKSERWKLQPASGIKGSNNDVREWERLVYMDKYDAVGGAYVVDGTPAVKFFYYEEE